MTDKQIIIDGIDVSGCPCIQSNNIGDVVCVRLARTSLYCEGQPCYYKALERKEQECKRLKSDYFTVIKQRNIAEQQLDELKAENDKLKVRNIEYMNGNIGYQLKNSLYKQTLTEIKEIAETCSTTPCSKCKFADVCTTINTDLILQKISECDI